MSEINELFYDPYSSDFYNSLERREDLKNVRCRVTQTVAEKHEMLKINKNGITIFTKPTIVTETIIDFRADKIHL